MTNPVLKPFSKLYLEVLIFLSDMANQIPIIGTMILNEDTILYKFIYSSCTPESCSKVNQSKEKMEIKIPYFISRRKFFFIFKYKNKLKKGKKNSMNATIIKTTVNFLKPF